MRSLKAPQLDARRKAKAAQKDLAARGFKELADRLFAWLKTVNGET
jgi:hypothetical protein